MKPTPRSDLAARARSQVRHDRIKAGTWHYRQPVETVAAHIETLLAAGMHAKHLAAVAGVSVTTLTNIQRARTRTVNGDTAAAILSVPLPAAPSVPGDLVPACGIRRRIRALCVNGYGLTRQEALCGIESTTLLYVAYGGRKTRPGLGGKARYTTRSTAVAVISMYARYWDKPLPRDKWTSRVRNVARRNGWHGPDAWDDDTLDDPAAEPYAWRLRYADQYDEVAVGYVVSGFRRWTYLTREVDRREVVRRLAAKGLAPGGIASRVSTSTAVIRRLLSQLDRRDVAA